jgi:hypothetical protein
VSERGGPTTQHGIYFQNTVAAGHLIDLLDLSALPPKERVIEVRVEAPAKIDDIVVKFADGHRDWIQVKSRLRVGDMAWKEVWSNLAEQGASREFGQEDRLLLVLGERSELATELRELCERAVSASDVSEWKSSLTTRHNRLLPSIAGALGPTTDLLGLLRALIVRTQPLDEIERKLSRRGMGTATIPPRGYLSEKIEILAGRLDLTIRESNGVLSIA